MLCHSWLGDMKYIRPASDPIIVKGLKGSIHCECGTGLALEWKGSLVEEDVKVGVCDAD